MVAPNAVAENVFGTLGAVFVRRTAPRSSNGAIRVAIRSTRLADCLFFFRLHFASGPCNWFRRL